MLGGTRAQGCRADAGVNRTFKRKKGRKEAVRTGLKLIGGVLASTERCFLSFIIGEKRMYLSLKLS